MVRNDAQTTGRQRGDGGRPSGNNRTDRVTSRTNPGTHAQTETHDSSTARGRPGGPTVKA